MPQQQSPFLEGKYGWNFGEGGWNTGMDENLLKFSFMFDRNVDGIVATLPPAVNGQAYFLTTDNRLYFAVGTTWYSSPVPKWFTFTLRDTGRVWQYNGSTVVEINSPFELEERLDDIELTLISLGTAAFEDASTFATSSELDIVEAQSQSYTDALRQDLGGEDGGSFVGFGTQNVDTALKSVRSRTLYALDPEYGFVDSVAADNTAAAVALLGAAQDGDIIDFCGIMWRIYDGVAGIVSAGADPATDQAVPLSSVPRLVNKVGITIRNGGLYAADQGVSPDKRYFPSTLYLKGCRDITFGPGAKFESRGESFGDADASLPLSVTARQDFLAVNGGHAVVMVRCRDVQGTLETRLCGSCAPLYSSSCYNVRLNNSFSNPASLGYAAYCADAWCGTLADTGFPEHSLYLDNCYTHAETLTRREDGAAVGSALYSSKNGVLNEDPSVVTYVTGGYYADAYGNSGTEGFQQGAAFGSGSSHMEVTGARIHNCSYAASTAVSSDYPGTIRLHGVSGDVGAAVYYSYKRSFSYQECDLIDCDIQVTDTRFIGEITESAYVINQVQNTPLNVRIKNCRFRGAKQLWWKPNKATHVSYGGITIDGGEYETIGLLCNFSGWGGAGAGTRQGMTIKGGARIYDTSDLTSTYVIGGNAAGATLTYLWWDLRDCEVQTKTPRNVAGLVASGPATLQERIWYPDRFESAYSTSTPRYAAQQSVTFLSLNGLAGSDQRIIVRCNGRFPMRFPCAIIGTGGKLVGIKGQVAAAAYNSGTGNLEHEVYCDGTPAAGILVANTEYPIVA